MRLGIWFLNVDSWQELLLGILVRVIIILGILPIHETAHAWAANKLGDDTAKRMGRLTLNPLPHIDWLGAACIMLLGFGWAKPVPVNPYGFRNRSKMKRGMALTALAGPVSNLLCAIAGTILFRAIICIPMGYNAAFWTYYAFTNFVFINVTLAVFNLLPVYPLDGSRILGWVLPDSVTNFFERNSRVISLVFMALIFLGVLDGVISFLAGGAFNAIFGGVNWLFDLIGLRANSWFV